MRQGAPAELVQSLKGRVWRKSVAKAALDDYRARYQVISNRLFAGQTMIHVLADADPGDGFEPIGGNLEDLYFSTLASTRRAA